MTTTKTKMSDVQIGDVWVAKVSGRTVEVRIDSDNGYLHDRNSTTRRANTHQGWQCTNLATRKVITAHIQRLRRLVSRRTTA